MTLFIYDDLDKTKREFRPLNPPKVLMYVCGPTVYDYCHLGHAKSYVSFDVVRKYMEYFKKFDVKYVQNFTDIDDKIIRRANEIGDDPFKLAEKFTKEYFIDAEELGIKRADSYPQVTLHIQEIIEFTKKLIETGFAYADGKGNVYYDVSKFPTYGKLSNFNPDESRQNQKIPVEESGKDDPLDFALWKAAKAEEPSWESPWGAGRPGWHIECSAMSVKHLGEQIDIHGGGMDLCFPHHENEIAQSEAYNGGKRFAQFWMHNGFIIIKGEKMSKSLGNFFTIKDLLKKYDAKTIRYFLVSTHYKSPVDYGEEELVRAEASRKRIQNCYDALKKCSGDGEASGGPDDSKLIDACGMARTDFENAMDDDFNTPLAMRAVFDLVSVSNKAIDSGIRGKKLAKVVETLEEFDKVLGILSEPVEFNDEVQGAIDELIAERDEARKNKDWKRSDSIRAGLGGLGITVEDSKDGTRSNWKLQPGREMPSTEDVRTAREKLN